MRLAEWGQSETVLPIIPERLKSLNKLKVKMYTDESFNQKTMSL